jgi:hypothetical protein
MKSKVYVDNASVGRGVLARVPIEPRETIFYLTGKLICFEEAVKAVQGEYTIQIGVDRYIDPYSPARYLNHSCSPNAGFVDEVRLIALRQLVPGEEVSFDYSTTMLERYWELDCSCGSPQCRGRIRDFDLLPSALQRHYLRLGIVQEYILNEVRSVAELALQIA